MSNSSEVQITLPDGSVKVFSKGVTGLEIASSISEGLARNVLAAKVNGEVWDATRPIYTDATVTLLTWTNDEGKSTFWHSSAHLMAEALEALDRKSTRLNSSHVRISYAVFCLKKKRD